MLAPAPFGEGEGVVAQYEAEMARLADLALEGRFAEALELHYSILPVIRACFLETNPIPVKAAMAAETRVRRWKRYRAILLRSLARRCTSAASAKSDGRAASRWWPRS